MNSPITKYIKRLTIEEYYQAKERLSHVVKYLPKDSENGSIALIKQENWIAVPIVIEGGFFQKTLESFVKAAKNYERSEIITTWIEPIISDSSPTAFSAPAIEEGVKEFNRAPDLLLMNCVVFAGNPDWVYIWFVDYFNIIYARESITQLFINNKPDEAFQTFYTSLNELPELRAVQEYFKRKGNENTLERLYNNLKKFNNALPGTEVIIWG